MKGCRGKFLRHLYIMGRLKFFKAENFRNFLYKILIFHFGFMKKYILHYFFFWLTFINFPICRLPKNVIISLFTTLLHHRPVTYYLCFIYSILTQFKRKTRLNFLPKQIFTQIYCIYTIYIISSINRIYIMEKHL